MGFNIKRRNILKASTATLLTGSLASLFLNNDDVEISLSETPILSNLPLQNRHVKYDSAIRDNLQKVKNFNQTFPDDIYLTAEKQIVFQSTLKRILRVKKLIGYANFNLVSFDDMLLYAHRYPKIGMFSKAELALIDEVFFYDANKYGFHGNKVIKDLTSTINKKDTIKISGSGHYLFQGDALAKFDRLKNDVGPDLVLTSGVRSIVKQLELFLSKLNVSDSNLSLASRSLAPPGHSYHGIGDFDVGKKGFGKFNFTSKFADTSEYKKLIELKYVDLRYTQDNKVGVRYEPWHIKVV